MSKFDSIRPTSCRQGITLRQAAVIGGLGILITVFTAPFFQFGVHPTLVSPGNIEETAQNFVAYKGLFIAGMFALMICYVADLLVAWAFYVLLLPVNRSLSLLTAWLRLLFTVIGFVSLTKFVAVYRLLTTPSYVEDVATDQLHAQIQFLLKLNGYEWSAGVVFLALHLGLLGYLVYRSSSIPRILGVLLTIAGFGYLAYYVVGPFLPPDVDLGFLMVTFFGELVFMLWLLVKGWKIQEPTEDS